MPMKIADAGIAKLYANLEAQRAANPNVKIDQTQVLNILALVGDSAGATSAKVLTQLQRPGITQAEQIEIAKKGMSATEKKDLAKILDGGTVPLEPSARAFLEAVMGPPAPPPAPDSLQVVGNQAKGLSGMARAGDRIEAINISAAPAGRLHMDDTMEIGKVDSTGHFANAQLKGDQAIQEGDLIRMRARHADGSVGDWLTVKAKGTGSPDTRNAVVSIQRIGLNDAGNGKISVSNINASRQVSEPGATLQFTNQRTGEKQQTIITDIGGFLTSFKLSGQPGDVFSVAATDGKNNTDFSTEVGKLTVPGGAPVAGDLIKDPALHKDELNADGSPKFVTKRFTGPLFGPSGPSPAEVQQGQLGDCYFPSAMAALAQNNAAALVNMIKDNKDGTYTVTFKEKDWGVGTYKDVKIKIDGDLYVRSWGGPLYGATFGPDKSEKTMKLWFPLLEKAWATWKGSYNAIGNGGMSSDVFQAVLGKDGEDMSIKYADPDEMWKTIKNAIDGKQPVSAGTYGESKDAMYTNTGVHSDHSYSVLGYVEEAGNLRKVTLRNPWGEVEPAGNGPDDGVFNLPLNEFQKLYQTLMFTNK
jgi:hypothetical protein